MSNQSEQETTTPREFKEIEKKNPNKAWPFWIQIAIFVTILASLYALFFREESDSLFKSSTFSAKHVHEQLKNHTKEFRKEIIKVTDGVYVGVGYGMANCIVLETKKSLIIVDVLESVETAKEFYNDFKSQIPSNISSKPIEHLVYTHYHPDHVFGADIFINDKNNVPNIIAHSDTKALLSTLLSIVSSTINVRSIRQLGSKIYEFFPELFENSGIGPFYKHSESTSHGKVRYPTIELTEPFTEMIIYDLKVHFYHAMGETNDQIFVFLPDKQVLLPADNLYRAFPNLYAIRGTPSRDARKWIESIDKMRNLKPLPKYLVPSHTRPIIAENNPNEIYELLTVYRDGIQYLHDQTIRYMNLKYHPDDMITLIRQQMPLRLKNHPFLQEYYGTYDWSIRAIFDSYVGWFSGEVSDLYPLPKAKQGQKLLQLMNNNIEILINHLTFNLQSNTLDNCQWSLQISTNLIQGYTNELYKNDINNKMEISKNELKQLEEIRLNSMQCLATFMKSANGRNYYITTYLEESNQINYNAKNKARQWVMHQVSIKDILDMLTVRLKIGDEKYLNDLYLNIVFYITYDDNDNNDNQNDNDNHDVNITKSGAKKIQQDSVIKKKYDEFFIINIRDGIAELIEEKIKHNQTREQMQQYIENREDVHIAVQINELDFRNLISEETSGLKLLATGRLKILKGSITTLAKFTNWFERE